MHILKVLLLFVYIAAGSFHLVASPLEHVEQTPGKEQDPNIDGVVEVSFRIDNTGKVEIINMNSTSPQLAEYVIKKLNKVQLRQGSSEIGKVIRYRFVFKKQA